MPRYAITSNLKEFPNSALRKASALIDAFIISDDKTLTETTELTINYNPETKNVFLSDAHWNLWFLDKRGYGLKKRSATDEK